MMEIFVQKTENSANEKRDRLLQKRADSKKTRNRRSYEKDRRRSVREGLLVSISSKKERRSYGDRRELLTSFSDQNKKSHPEGLAENSLFCTVV